MVQPITHSSQRYTMKSVYNNLTVVEVDFHMNGNHVLWLKVISLRVNICIWHLLLNRISTKDNLFRKNIITASYNHCSTNCSCMEDIDHLLF